MRLRPGLRSGLRWGSLHRLAGNGEGPPGEGEGKGEEGDGRGGRGQVGMGGEGREGKGRGRAIPRTKILATALVETAHQTPLSFSKGVWLLCFR